MTNINAVYINPMLFDSQQESDFEAILAEQSGQIETDDFQAGDEIIYTDDAVADMIIANGVITESIRQMRENEEKLKEILDEV
ncbi:putative nAD-specific glutamate dehydrogenase [Vibrio cholerae]|uniref:VPA1340 family putative T3SS effector n=1 Tax=Vibrio cholerae TaxID=666 RepID=UPI00208486C0|nr:putative nAD-specific glutamate dehydrogenase [Vibrio cholerae]GHW69388.1 putative nAD-specific glutamate dehydrogenase [Vibrio cholerae]GIB18619.1 putative nAD-specific glutamate dehydrogenase [Vibrio cholerae]